MGNRKLTNTITVSLVALAAATGAAVLEAGRVAAAPDAPSPVPTPYPNVSVDQKIPGLTLPAIKIEQKVPGIGIPAATIPGIKIAQKIAAYKIAGVIHGLPGDIQTDPR